MGNDNPQQPPAISADFPFAVRHVQVHGARMAYVDEAAAIRSCFCTAIQRRRICGAT